MKLSIKTTCFLILNTFSLVSFSVHAANISEGEKKAAQCTGCHGVNGVSKAKQFPILAGQQAAYIVRQLTAFKEESRKNPIMQGIAKGLTDTDMENLAAFFANAAYKPTPSNDKTALAGKSKYMMCGGCHGAEGEGRGMIPRLANQHPEYFTAQLNAFKNGTRVGGPMPSVAKNLTDADIKALAAYIQTLK